MIALNVAMLFDGFIVTRNTCGGIMGIFCPTIEDNADPRASFPLQLAVQMGKIVLIIVGYGFREKKL